MFLEHVKKRKRSGDKDIHIWLFVVLDFFLLLGSELSYQGTCDVCFGSENAKFIENLLS